MKYRAIILLLVAQIVAAEENLSLPVVLDSARTHFPAIQAAIQETLIREGRLQTALGAFDLALEQDGKVWSSGFYDGLSLDNKLVKPLPWANAKAFAGYRVSNDDFPIYQQELVTNDGGEFNIGVVFSLWRDRAIDDRRFKVSKAELDIEQAELELFLAQLTTQRSAAAAYWRWVAAGQRFKVFERLTELAEKRMDGLVERVAAGDVAKIYVTENRQNLLRRQAIMRQSQLDFQAAAIELSLYLRDANGAPRILPASILPAPFAEPGAGVADPQQLAQEILERRPELARLENRLALETRRLELAENSLMPRVDVGVKASHDLGDGSRTREGFESIVDLSISIPLERRTGLGQVSSARAAMEKLKWERTLLENRLTTEIIKLATSLNAARDFVAITNEEASQAQVLEEAERVRFAAGDSDFFLVNLREERSADARIRNLDSSLQYHLSRVDLQAISMDLASLRLTR
ncbi:MAG: TolC family protein [Gammaproteobacteria bacterium]